jgi:nitrite reductase (NADH) large subunit
MISKKIWKCEVCGYMHEGETPCSVCPICGVDSTYFTLVQTQETEPVQQHANNDAVKVVIVGAGVAGMTAAATLADSEKAEITIVSSEKGLPYYRLNLTRFLAGEVEEESLLMQEEDWFKKNNINFIEDLVISLDAASKSIELKNGQKLLYDKLILATGSNAFIPPLEGIDKKGVTPLRTIEDATYIIEQVKTYKKAVVMGGGLLGLEAAGALAKRGCQVTVLESYKWILPRQLPREGAQELMKVLKEKGIVIRTESMVKQIAGQKRVEAVVLSDDSRIEADIVIVSTGIRPSIELAKQAGLKVDKALVVNDEMFSSDSNILAAGDGVEFDGNLYGLWPMSFLQGKIAGANAVGEHQKFKPVPMSTRLKVEGVDMFSAGIVNPEEDSLVLKKQEDSLFKQVILKNNILVGAALVGDSSLSKKLQEAIEAQATMDKVPELKNEF